MPAATGRGSVEHAVPGDEKRRLRKLSVVLRTVKIVQDFFCPAAVLPHKLEQDATVHAAVIVLVTAVLRSSENDTVCPGQDRGSGFRPAAVSLLVNS